MDVDEHLLWLLSALRFAPGSNGVDKDKLIQNVNNCFIRVKKDRKAADASRSQATEEIRDFQAKAAVLLLLCLPEIRKLSCVKKCADFQSVISSLPELSYSVFFTVVRTQKIYFFLSSLLSWLPPNVVQTLTREYFHYTDEVTPVTLTIAVELLKSLIFSYQYRYTYGNSQSNTECFELLVKFFSSKNVSSDTPSMIKFSGYFFMYMIECLYLLLAAYVGHKIRDPGTLSCVEAWTKLWKTTNTSTEDVSLLYTKETMKSMLVLCQKNNREVTIDMWMEWSEQKLPQNVTVCPAPSAHQPGKGRAKSIQLVTCNIAFDILKLFEVHSQLEEDLATEEYHELLQFLQQVATNPEYDPDQDLTLEQLIEEINIKDDRQEKLLGYLVQKDGVIASDDVCTCLKKHAVVLDTHMKIELLQNCLDWLKAGKPHIPEIINVVLDLAADLSPEQLKLVIEDSLSAGLDDTLKTPSFTTQLTAVFNQLADENTTEPSGKHLWLCLQSGRGVVEQAVRLAVTMTGLVPVMVQALADLPYVLQAKLPSGNSLLVSTLVEWQTSELCDREEQEFIVLVKNLLNMKGLLDAEEVLHMMVEPFMVIESSRNLETLILPLELLKEVMTHYIDVVVRPGPALVSLVMALIHVVDATVCLEDQGASSCLAVRCLASAILAEITSVIANSQKKFETDITLFKQIVCQYGLHPWSIMHISRVVNAELSGGSGVDLLLQALMKTSPDLLHGSPLDSMTCATLECAGFEQMSKAEWTVILLQLLPHCSENEWKSAFFITDHVLGSQNTVFPVLEVFQGILCLVCESCAPTLHHQKSHSLPPPVSLHHCFNFFASASMIYLEEKFQTQNSRRQFLNLADIFRWWCCIMASFCCNPELPTLFLAKLCWALEEIVVSGKLKMRPEGHTVTDTDCDAPSLGVSEREDESLPEKDTSKVYIEINEKKEKQCEEMHRCNKPIERPMISEMDVKKELEQITFFMVKYVPFSNLLASVACKLKKIV